MATSVVAFNFPNPVLTPPATLNEPPCYATIRKMQTELNANAASVHSNAGNGVHGYLILTMIQAEYLNVTGSDVEFEVPKNPTLAPDHSDDSTAVHFNETNRQHKEDQLIFKTFHDLDRALCKLILEATPLVFLRALNDPDLGFGNVTCLQLLYHL